MAEPATKVEFLAFTLARLVADARTVAVGTNSPIPAAAILLAREQNRQTTISILGSPRHTPFTDGGRELFDFAAQGRLAAFFLGGGQIDGAGNINLLGIGRKLRFPGSFGAPYLYSLVPNVVLFREEHSPRVLVPQVDVMSAVGSGPDGSYRPGGPRWLVTERAVFRFDQATRRFVLNAIHPSQHLDEVTAQTGFAIVLDDDFATTPSPTDDALALLRGPVARELAYAYPQFAARHFSAPEGPRHEK